MRLHVATNFDPKLLKEYSRYPVRSIFGSMPDDPIGGGRASTALSQIKWTQLKRHVREAHQNGIEFNYTVNTTCLNNQEFTRQGFRKIVKHIERLVEIGIDGITLSLPSLMEIVRRHFPELKIIVSVFNMIDTLQRALFYEDLGVHEITLDQDINRDFDLLEKIRKRVQCELQLVVNNSCLYRCPFYAYHPLQLSHASRRDDALHGYYIDFSILTCLKAKIEHPVNLIRSRWIRPEDLHFYEDIGIDKFKITERTKGADWLLRAVNAYASRKYEGNLIDILNIPRRKSEQAALPKKYYIMKLGLANPYRLRQVRDSLFLADLYVDNTKLEGFLEFFRRTDCHSMDCGSCGYCQKIAEQVIIIGSRSGIEASAAISKVLKDIISGRIYRLL